jgi:crotonobetainyl-CoA:carnitine CoA-transferase CaiB-like acyl-CoA transferase
MSFLKISEMLMIKPKYEYSMSHLQEIRVVDISRNYSGILCSLLLADQGIEIIYFKDIDSKINATTHAVLSRGKNCYPTDWKNENSRDLFKKTLENADVLILDWSIQELNDFNLDLNQLSTKYPRLSQLRITGFPKEDKRYYLPADDGLIAACTALFTDISITRSILKLPPKYSALPLASAYAAVHGAIGIMTTLLQQQTDILEISLSASTLSAMGVVVLEIEQPRRYDLPPLPKKIAAPLLSTIHYFSKYSSLQKTLLRLGEKLLPPLLTTYTCRDGRLIYIVAMDHEKHAQLLCNYLNITDELKYYGLGFYPLYAPSHRFNLSESNLLSLSNKQIVQQTLARKFKTKDALDWEKELNENGIPAMMVRNYSEWLSSKHALKAELVINLQDEDLGNIRQSGKAVSLYSDTENHVLRSISRCAPLMNEKKIHHLNTIKQSKGLPLQGLRVLDLSCVIAGPTCTRTLCELGAEVIKIDSPKPLHGPRLLCQYGIDVNHGKKSLLLDLKKPEGLKIFQEIARSSMIIVHNFSSSALKRLHLTQNAPELNNLIWCHVSAFKGPKASDWDHWKGYDPILQAATGIMQRYGSYEKPELHGIASCVDYLTGYLGAYGILLALFKKKFDHTRYNVNVSLAQAAQFIQLPLLCSNQSSTASNHENINGEAVNKSIYQARDCWFYLNATVEQLKQYIQYYLNKEVLSYTVLQKHFAKINYKKLIERFDQLSISSHQIESIQNLRDSTHPFQKQKLIENFSSSNLSILKVNPCYVKSQNWCLHNGPIFPKYGADTLKILSDIGISHHEKAQLLKNQVISIALSNDYLPH